MKPLLSTALFVFASFFGCAHTAAGPAAPRINGQQARVLSTDEDAQLIDVRSATEFDMGHIAGAINIPVARIAEDGSGERDRPVILYYLSGHRSARAAAELLRIGTDEVYDLGSLRHWD
ncbi:MAG: rhodanese-related sulfurtransferase [Bradymonadia bacterium]|jgi:rhodanese-related sulfurtransferase